MRFSRAAVEEAADLITSKFQHTWSYFCQFRFALAVGQRALMADIPLTAPSLEIGINDGSSATITQYGKPKFTWGGDMPEANTYESMGLYVEPQFDKYENVIGMDAHAIPFADASFNTVITNDMLGYDVDRERIVSEMVRVLAPGGTLFFTESGSGIEHYPHLMDQLRRFVPTVDVLKDPVASYTAWLHGHGIVDIRGDTYLNHRLVALLNAWLFRGETLHPITDETRGFYEESLRALTNFLAEDAGEGWQVYMTCRKPGEIKSLPTPEPVCLKCRSPLTRSLDACGCPSCNTEYRSEWGNPYVLSDFTKVYSPKATTSPTTRTDFVRTALADLMPKLPATVAIYGFDKSTRYVIRSLASRGIKVEAIYSDNPLFIGATICGVTIRPSDVTSTLPAVVSAYTDDVPQSYHGQLHRLSAR